MPMLKKMKVALGVLCCFSVIPVENSEQHKLFFINIPRTDSVMDPKEMKAAQIISFFKTRFESYL